MSGLLSEYLVGECDSSGAESNGRYGLSRVFLRFSCRAGEAGVTIHAFAPDALHVAGIE
jgi:hypothetical protein